VTALTTKLEQTKRKGILATKAMKLMERKTERQVSHESAVTWLERKVDLFMGMSDCLFVDSLVFVCLFVCI
jgi:hypothetical protein